MPAVLVPEVMGVSKRKRPKGSEDTQPGDEDEGMDSRIEFVASKSMVRAIDRAAKAHGMGRSAYIRMAVLRQIRADAKENQ